MELYIFVKDYVVIIQTIQCEIVSSNNNLRPPSKEYSAGMNRILIFSCLGNLDFFCLWIEKRVLGLYFKSLIVPFHFEFGSNTSILKHLCKHKVSSVWYIVNRNKLLLCMINGDKVIIHF
jgi:hypothetical protein